jgi:hypothetical protein
MAVEKKSTLRALVAILALSCGYLGASWQAAASQDCPEATVGICFPEYREISTIAATGQGFAAIASREDGLDLLMLDGAGRPVGPPRSITIPQWLAGAGTVELAIKRLVPGAGGTMLMVGWAALQSEQQTGVLIMIDRDGAVLWSKRLMLDADTSVIAYSAAYDAPARRFLVVGRHTNGPDDGKCKAWSQAIVASVSERSGNIDSIRSIGRAESGFDNRIALQDIAPTGTPGHFVAAGFATHRNSKGNGCQDDAMAVQISGGTADDWNIGEPYSIGGDNAGEVAFAVAAAGNERFLVAGYGVEEHSQARAALVASFAFGSEPSVVTHPFPENGSDTSGGDRYRVIVPLREPGSFLVAGSGSTSKAGRNQGIWRVLPASLDPAGPLRSLTTQSGSDILGAARGSDGGVVGVGANARGSGSMGWIGLIFEPEAPASERREPDTGLPLFSAAETAAGLVEISEREISKGIGFRQANAKAGTEMELSFSLSDGGNVAVSALPSSGDVDLVLLDKAGDVVAFSSNLNDAGEYLSAVLAPDAYRVKVVAVSDTAVYEVRLTAANTEADVLATLQLLNAQSRKELSQSLQQAGYGTAGNPDIGFGGDTVRAVLASFNTAWPDMKPEAVEKFIVDAFSTEQ